MSYYRKHMFFCMNQRNEERKCCNNAGASDIRAYTKQKINELGLAGENGVRVNMAGCLGRCQQGPSLVIYPDGTWYTYKNQTDIDEIIDQHILHGHIVERLLMDPNPINR